ASNTESVACKLSWCWREEGLGAESERGEKCWKNVDAVAGSSALHSGDSSVIASMLLSIQPCSSEVRGSGVSGEVYGTRAGGDATVLRQQMQHPPRSHHLAA